MDPQRLLDTGLEQTAQPGSFCSHGGGHPLPVSLREYAADWGLAPAVLS
jgi:hypothetical protein